MTRIQKLRIFQITLLIIGILIIYLTYYQKKETADQQLVPKEIQEKIKEQLANQPEGYDVFSDIEYSGLDLSGNRYILKSKQAFNETEDQEVVNLISVEATFYFKDNTVLKVTSEKGKYNNKTLDMYFYNNVVAKYEESKLFAQKAEFSNLKSNLIITENVKLEDKRGTMFADKLFFDIKNQKLNITALENNKINANIKVK